MRVKICGITNVNDAKFSEEVGADAIGVILCSDSPRSVDFDRAANILSSVGPYITTVCVSRTKSEIEMEKMIKMRPSAIQIYHDMDIPEGIKIIRALARGDAPRDDCEAILVDESGGTGKRYDYRYARKVVRASKVPVILSGGLTPDNVREAIESVRPYAVDVSSGVESSPGVKDRGKIRAFVEACKGEI
jgi:phosphoribosylanthranilate isomerase